MQEGGKLLLGLALFVLSLQLCYAQHWSYGLRPGGKRDSEYPMDPLQDVSYLKPSERHFGQSIPATRVERRDKLPYRGGQGWTIGNSRYSGERLQVFAGAGNEVDKPEEVQHFECTVPQRKSHLGLLQGALMSWLEGEPGRKRLLFNEGKAQ